MTFSALGAVLAASMTSTMADRERAQQLTLVGGLLGQSTLGVVLVSTLVAQAGRGGSGTTGPGGPVPVLVVIPAVAGLDALTARKRLSAVGLVTTVSYASAPEAGTVVGTEPPEATLVRTGSTVTLLVGIGLPVPNVVGTQVKEAQSVVEAAGFEAEVVEVKRPDGGPGVVLSQDPDGGTYLAKGATVILTTVKHRDEAAVEANAAPSAPVLVGKVVALPAEP